MEASDTFSELHDHDTVKAMGKMVVPDPHHPLEAVLAVASMEEDTEGHEEPVSGFHYCRICVLLADSLTVVLSHGLRRNLRNARTQCWVP